MSSEAVASLLKVFPQLVPEAILALAACILFIGATVRRDRKLWGSLAVISLLASLLALWLVPRPAWTAETEKVALFTNPIWTDRLALWIKAIAIVGGMVLVFSSWDDVPEDQIAEYHACLLLIVAGLCVAGSANELVTLFLGLELVSIPTYLLLCLPRFGNQSHEAAMKYFMLSIFSSGLTLFGFSYLYGLTGTTNIPGMTRALSSAGGFALPAVAQIALVMVVAGMGFRISAVPFHFYAPDVYQGTTNSAAALLAFAPKVAGFVALLRILGDVPHQILLDDGVRVGGALGAQVPNLLWIVAAATMTLGNILALLQDNLRRLLAYSSVAQAGYMLIALAAIPAMYSGGQTPDVTGGVDALLFYLIAYGAMTIGAFTVFGTLSRSGRPVEKVDDLAGLGTSHPGLALLLMLFLLSLIGIPLTAGFAGKVLLFVGALSVPGGEGGTGALSQVRLFRILAVVGVVNAAIGAWYYLRIVMVMYLRVAVRPLPKVFSWPGLAALAICGAITLGAGVWPWGLWKPARQTMPQITSSPPITRAP